MVRGVHQGRLQRTHVGGPYGRADGQAADGRFFDGNGRLRGRRLKGRRFRGRRRRNSSRNTFVARRRRRRRRRQTTLQITVIAVVVVVVVVDVVMMMMVVVWVMGAVVRVVLLQRVVDGGTGKFVGRGSGGRGRDGDGRRRRGRGGRGSGGHRARGGMVVFAQAADGYAGVRSAGAAHAFRGPVVVIVLARRQAAALDQEQRTAVGVQQRTDVLQDFVTQRPHVQFVAYVFHLKNTHNGTINI